MDKIEQQGLQKYLDGSTDIHNNQGYVDFAFYIIHRVPVSAIGRMFFVNRKTVEKWRNILKEERSK
jgi:hypothetical protein